MPDHALVPDLLKRLIDIQRDTRNEICCKLRDIRTEFKALTAFKKTSLATTNSTSITSVETSFYGLVAINTTGSAKYVKLYNKASAPTVGTDTPVITFQIPANGSVNLPADVPTDFSLGLGMGITGAAGDSDTTAVAAGDVIVTVTYR